ncbi:hypothetical protein, partial [Paralimibaculum aggregatum]|uniref:hypothetical protein n=1 Tax=Paralimibaculum aggregatum TaxID=3036245 RepID=UPI0025575D17
ARGLAALRSHRNYWGNPPAGGTNLLLLVEIWTPYGLNYDALSESVACPTGCTETEPEPRLRAD